MSRGGKRKGAGNPGTKRVSVRRKPVTINILPSTLSSFKKKHGKKWAREVERLMIQSTN